MAYLNLISYVIVLPLFHFILAEVGVQPQNTAPQFNFDLISLSQELYKLFTQDWVLLERERNNLRQRLKIVDEIKKIPDPKGTNKEKISLLQKEERLLEQDVTLLDRERFNLKERRKVIEDLRQVKLNQQNGTNIDAQASMGIQNLGNGSAVGMDPNAMGPPGPGMSQVSGQSDTQASYSMNNNMVNPDGSISQVNMGAMPNDGQENVMPAGMSMTPQTDGVNLYQDTQYDSNGQYSSGVSPPATDNNLNFSPQQQQLGPSNQPESFTQPLPNGSVQTSNPTNGMVQINRRRTNQTQMPRGSLTQGSRVTKPGIRTVPPSTRTSSYNLRSRRPNTAPLRQPAGVRTQHISNGPVRNGTF